MINEALWNKNNLNYAMLGDGFFVSYLPPGVVDAKWMKPDNDGAETALVKDGFYYILNGDWSSDYEVLVPQGFDACLAFYESRKEQYNSSFTSDNDEGIQALAEKIIEEYKEKEEAA